MVHECITLELATRIRNAKGYSDISEAAKKKLRRMSGVLIVIITLAFVSFAVTVIASAHKPGNDGAPFFDIHCSVLEIFGYSFLG